MSCNQNCNQGRTCSCKDDKPLTMREKALVALCSVIYLGSWSYVIYLSIRYIIEITK